MTNLRLYIILILLVSAQAAAADDNPFRHMASKPYSEYGVALHGYISEIDRADSLVSLQRLQQIRDVARETGSLRWQLEARIFEISYRFRIGFRDDPRNTYHAEDALQDILSITDEAIEKGDTIVYLRTLRSIMNIYNNLLYNYELAFEYAWKLDEKMRGISPYRFPDKLSIYREIALMYYTFKDYDQALFFFNRMLEDEQAAIELNLAHAAYNGIALVYRNRDKDLDKSDEYFHRIIDIRAAHPEQINTYRIWEGIGKGNLGYNYFLRGNYDEALPLLEFSYRRMLEYEDYHYASSSTLALANVYIIRENLPEAKKYIDRSRELIDRSPIKDRTGDLYHVTAKYYALLGNSRLTMLYADSAMQTEEENDLHFSALKLRHAEQRAYRMEQKLKEEELLAEQASNRNYRITIWIVSVSLLLVVGLLVYSNILYRKRRAAYRELVKKARQWAAGIKPEPPLYDAPVAPEDEAEAFLIQEIARLMDDEKAYLNNNLTLDTLAEQLHTGRAHLSAVINRQSGSNFNQFVNDYRIREAIRLLDSNGRTDTSIDTIAFDCGFNNRISFYRAFKKATGLSPSDYRTNK